MCHRIYQFIHILLHWLNIFKDTCFRVYTWSWSIFIYTYSTYLLFNFFFFFEDFLKIRRKKNYEKRRICIYLNNLIRITQKSSKLFFQRTIWKKWTLRGFWGLLFPTLQQQQECQRQWWWQHQAWQQWRQLRIFLYCYYFLFFFYFFNIN